MAWSAFVQVRNGEGLGPDMDETDIDVHNMKAGNERELGQEARRMH